MHIVKDSPRDVTGDQPVALSPGQIMPGSRYRILAKLGEGAMGEVYLAEHVDLEKKVALKLLNASFARQPEGVERFRQEARAASRIGSPFICDVTDFGHIPDGRVFFVMEYLDGKTLRTVLGTQGTLAASRLIGVLRQVCKALGAAHEKGIIHLDVKPDNVMVRELNRRPDAAKVVDFGIAGLMNTQERQDRISGTPEYIAPERALGKGYGHRSDIYSLGVMTYELLTGAVPFLNEGDVTGLLRRHVHEGPVPLRQRVPDAAIPAELETLVMQMLAKDPADRPQSMAVVEAMLCEAQIAAGITTPWDDLEIPQVDEAWQKKLLERMPHPRRATRKSVVIGAITVAFAAVAVAMYFGVFQAPQVKIEYVTVEGKKTAEAPSVVEWLEKAKRAARAQRYTGENDSALAFREKGEGEATRLSLKSEGAAQARRVYADALALAGNQLREAKLPELAVAKYKEALQFVGDDPDLQKLAELTATERRDMLERARARAAQRIPAPVPPKAISTDEEANRVAGSAYMAAEKGGTSEARASLKKLAQLDPGGLRAARLADAFRNLGRKAWDSGKTTEARAYFALVTDIDPKDPEAVERLRSETAPARAAAAPPAAPPSPAPVSTAEVAMMAANASKKSTDMAATPHEIAQSASYSAAGTTALAKGRLADAEMAFNRAVRLNPANASAVGGLAEVAFERGRYTDSLDYGRSAVKLAPKSPRYLTVVGDAYFKLLRYKEAQGAYAKAHQLAPDDDRIKSRLDRVKAKSK